MTYLSISAIRDVRLLSDNELMAGVGRGDEASLGEILRRYQKPLTSFLARIVNDLERARDLAQETFIRIFRHRTEYKPELRFATWLYHIARNVARDELRARRRRISFAPAEAAAEERKPVACCDPDVFERLEMRERIGRVLSLLPERDRALIVLRDADGLSYGEVATRVGLPVGTVKSGLSRARRRFRECLSELDAAS